MNDDSATLVAQKEGMVLRFAVGGDFQHQFTCAEQPTAMAVNNDIICVADSSAHRVQIYDYEGAVLNTISGRQHIAYPFGLAITADKPDIGSVICRRLTFLAIYAAGRPDVGICG